ncbi:hypothetical protein V8E36_000164 [Tilletia maclaganii]
MADTSNNDNADDVLLQILPVDDDDDAAAPEAEADAGLTPRELRMRRAIEHAKASYIPIQEDHSWFIPPTLISLLGKGASISQSATGEAEDDQWTDAANIHIDNHSLESFIASFLHADKRSIHKLDWTLSALYAHNCTRAALTLALALLRTSGWALNTQALDAVSSLSELVEQSSSAASTTSSKSSKQRAKETIFVFEKEALDVALRCCTQLLHSHDDDESQIPSLARLLALRGLRYLPHDGLRSAVWDGDEEITGGWQRVSWTNTPGIALSVGHLCVKLRQWRAATIAYALYIGTRGPLRAASRSIATALANYALTLPSVSSSSVPQKIIDTRSAHVELAYAFAASYIGASTPADRRKAAIQEVKDGHIIPIELLPGVRPNAASTSASSIATAVGHIALVEAPITVDDGRSAQATLDLLLDAFRAADSCHASPSSTSVPLPLPPEAVIALVRCGPARKTSLVHCIRRLSLYLHGDGAGGGKEDDDDDVDGRVQVRSVRTL